MLRAVDFGRSLTLAERIAPAPGRATVDRSEYEAIVTDWRAGVLEDDEVFAQYLSVTGLDRDRLAERLDPLALPAPGSLGWVEELDRMNRWPVADEGPRTVRYGVQQLSEDPFPHFHAPLHGWLRAHLPVATGHGGSRVVVGPAAAQGLADRILSSVLERTVRALVEHAHQSGRPIADYRAALAHPSRREEVYRTFPVLARDVHRVLTAALRHVREIVDRLAEDLPELRRASLAGPDEEIVELSIGLGDPHGGGRTVSILTWGDGSRLVYRPQAGGIAAAAAVVAHAAGLTHDGRHSIRIPRSLDRRTHTWVEHIDGPGERADAAFYHRLGALAGFAWLLGARDLHMENVVSAPDGPVPVDIETMLSADPLSENHTSALARCSMRVNRGATASGLLPAQAVIGGGERLEASVLLGGLRTSRTQIQVLREDARGPVLVREEFETGRSRNLPKGASMESAREHLGALTVGFGAAATAMVRSRERIMAALRRSRTFPVRVVVRPTSTYSVLLHESRHPRYLRDMLAREHLLLRLWRDLDAPYLGAALVRAETAELLDGDIPYFTVPSHGCGLHDAHGRSVDSVVEASPVEALARALRACGAREIAEQTGLVRETVLAAVTPPEAPGEEVIRPQARTSAAYHDPLPPAAAVGLDAAELLDRLAQRFVESAVLGEADAGWVGMAPGRQGTSVALRPLDTSLFDGLAGVGFALGQAGIALGDESILALAERALLPVAEHLREWVGRPDGPVGAHSGAGGLAYAIGAHVLNARRIGRPVPGWWSSLPSRFVTTAADRLAEDRYLDLTSGTAGALAVATSLLEADLVERGAYARLVARALDHLRASAVSEQGTRSWPTGDDEVRLGGFSHGASGIGWAAARAAGHLGGTAGELARTALAFDDRLLDPTVGLWRDARPEWSQHRAFPVHWCHGAAGIALARAGAARALKDPAILRAAELATRATLGAAPPPNDSLCHGSLGNAEVLALARPAALAAEAERYRYDVLARLAAGAFVPGLGPHVTSVPGLMIGHAGLAHVLARTVEPQLPSVLDLGLTAGARRPG